MKYLWVLIAIVLIVVAVVLYATRSSTTSDSIGTETTPVESSTETKTDNNASAPTPTGQYVDYSSTVIANTTGTKILFFHAPWCPQCRALEASIKASTIPSDVTIIKVDYDTNQALRQKYGVTIQTTLVKVDDGGDLVKKYVAYDTPNFASLRDNLL